ncbi:AtpZ/AtpI family protein [Sphingobacteriaceae bacterium WQ 2009]|uniref:AtpZ/AtpI family protein n=1 Tax=Rhinopithecimicrobium faecis TaxID=2820698 RepID=A0A8T4H661_9SPHI|nr:AtpZ/AtpI family protein [Sphingobacteriaceae bacterium WQ 2009]
MKGSEKKPNKWLVFTSMSAQMVVTIYLFYLLASWLDSKYHFTSERVVPLITMLGVVISIYQVIRQANKMNEE